MVFLGLGARRHAVPFQCTISALDGPFALPVWPTAQAFRAEAAATSRRIPRTANEDARIAIRVRAAAAGVAGTSESAATNADSSNAQPRTQERCATAQERMLVTSLLRHRPGSLSVTRCVIRGKSR